MESISLYDLNEYLKRVVALNFTQPLWVTAEIAQLKTARGHYYLDVVQKNGDELAAQAAAVIWARQAGTLRRKLGEAWDLLMREGMQILMQVMVEYHEVYGLKLVIQDVDATYTVGQLFLQKQQILRELANLQLIDRNAQLPMPPVLQRIAVISSAQAAGYQDFRQHLAENPYGYAFRYRLFPAAMQGANVETEVLANLTAIAQQADEFDIVVIIRGGGAKTDLVAFDSLPLAKAIALMPLPVLTGIGHDIDETVADLVAYQSLKTPTAVADFILHTNMYFESSIEGFRQQIAQLTQSHLAEATRQLAQLHTLLPLYAQQRLSHAQYQLVEIHQFIKHRAQVILQQQHQQLQHWEQLVHFLSIEQTLARGFSLTLSEQGRVIVSAEEVAEGTLLHTRLADGHVYSKVVRGRS